MILKPANKLRGSKIKRNRDVQSQVPSLYIHIPFCKKKCNYCDFVSYAGKEYLIDEYVEALIRELHALTPLPEGEGVKTIYFGGGTPTLLEPHHLEHILNVAATFRLPSHHGGLKTAATLEISIEANPATANKAKLKELRQLGINRLSIGVQSFNNKHLQVLGRIHNSKDIFRIYEDAKAAGFDNINLDLIFALPNQTLEEWQEDLKTALSLSPEHLSTYNLIIEEGTPFAKMSNAQCPISNDGKTILEEKELAMYEYTIETLRSAGYKHYEISNFAKPGRECQHNLVYWRNENYLGLGAGAHSHINGKRWSNPNCLEKYLSLTPSFSPLTPHSSQQNQGETIFMGLRLLDGIAKDHFQGFEKEVEELTKEGLLTTEKNNLKLTRKGLYLANEVFLHFI